MTLSPREQDILGELLKGRMNKQIAHELGMTEGTVKIHLQRIFLKMNVTNRTELALKACGYL